MTGVKGADWSGEWSAAALARRVNAGECAVDAGVRRAHAAIVAANPALNAIVDYDPDVAAPQIDNLARRLKAGERPPLAGVPVTIKDHIHVAGWRCTEGSLLFRDVVATDDEPIVTLLRQAGAILIGRTNMSEFGCKGVTTNKLYGPTRHPLNGDLTTGGSSGGAAAAVAAGLAPLALASDGGGSVRRPAAHAGVVGYKPSTGLLPDPRTSSQTAVFGVMAGSVPDAAAMVSALAVRDRRDPVSVGLAMDEGEARAAPRLVWSPRLGLDVPVDDDVAAVLEAAVEKLRAAGLAIERMDPVWPEGAGEDAVMPIQHAELAFAFGADYHRDPSLFDPDIAVQIENGLCLDGVAICRAQAMSMAVGRAAAAFFAAGPDLLLAPTTPCVAWPHARLGPASIGGRAVAHRGHAVFTPLFNHAFCPAISIPAGKARDGLPAGLQIVGPRFADRRVLHFAARAEAILAGAP